MLLDTHVWLWLMTGDTALPSAARNAINSAAARGALAVAAISIWEIALLASCGRVRLGKPTLEWVEQSLSAPGLTLEPLSPRIAVESCQLPGQFHNDPADRIIAATARCTGAVLMTRDRRMLDYAALGHVAALAA